MSNINYEEFYLDIQQVEKSIKDKIQQAQRSFKNITRDAEYGDVKKLVKDIDALREAASELTAFSESLQDIALGFDNQDYFESGEFTRQMIDYCRQYGVDMKGEAGVYEMFPFRLRIDAENQDVYVNRKKIHCARPLQFVQNMKQQVEKYTKSNFNIDQFVNELAAAYDTYVKIKNSDSPVKRNDIDVFLKDVYTYLAPTARARKEYDLQQYAFDLSRLYAADEIQTKNERFVEFGKETSRNVNKLIRILDSNGAEQFLSTIRFFKQG